MIKLVYPQASSIQKIEKNNSSFDKGISSPDVTGPQLKLVVSNCDPLPIEPTNTKNQHVSSSLIANVHLRGPYLYEMTIEDPSHYLECDLILEVEEAHDEFESARVICHFPNISNEKLDDLVEGDETLLGMILVQFQMKILEQLLLFCATHYASKLVIFVDDAQADELEIYRDFLAYEDQTITPQGEKTEMIIPADREAFDQWIDFMEDVTIKFRQTLWREQKNNLAIRQYLERHSLFVV